MGGEILTFELARMPNQAFEPTSYLGGSTRRYTFFLPIIIKVEGSLTLRKSRCYPQGARPPHDAVKQPLSNQVSWRTLFRGDCLVSYKNIKEMPEGSGLYFDKKYD